MGGADSQLLKMIDILSKDHDVHAYIPVRKEGVYMDANIYPFNTIFDYPLECDLLIQNRKMWAIPNTLKYKKAVFYSQDTHDTPCFNGLKGNRKALDFCSKVWVLSEFHKKDLLKIFDIPEDKFFILGNAADEQPITSQNLTDSDDAQNRLTILTEKKPLQFIYASTPFRGLDVLLKIWTKIIEKYPTATLHLFSSMKIYGAEQLDDLHFGKMFEDLRNGRFKNVIHHGSVPQEEMLKCMRESFMLLYPNTYPETYCNVIMEARACRTPFITTDLGALKETGGLAGYYIEPPVREDRYINQFLERLDIIIRNNFLYSVLQDCCVPIRTFKDYEEDLLKEIERLRFED